MSIFATLKYTIKPRIIYTHGIFEFKISLSSNFWQIHDLYLMKSEDV